MRFTYLTALYPSYVEHFYRTRPGLNQQSYSVQKQAFDEDGFAWNGAWGDALAPFGYEVQSLYVNVEPLQKAWAREHGERIGATGWSEEIARAQIRAFRSEILFLDHLAVFRRPWLEAVRGSNAELRLILGFSGVYLNDFDTIRSCDAIFSCARRPLDHFSRGGGRAFLLRHAFNPAVLGRLPAPKPTVPSVVFAGSIARGAGSHLEREEIIETLVKAVPIDIYCPQGNTSHLGDFVGTNLRRSLYFLLQSLRKCGVSENRLHRLPRVGRAADWSDWPRSQINPRLRSRLKPPLYGLAMFTGLRDHAIALNKHIDMSYTEAGNSRLFEAAGAGACLLTDWKETLGEMFEPDREVVCYRSKEECVEKAKWLLNHPIDCAALARAGQKRVLREHTFAHRAAGLHEVIRTRLLP